MSGDALSELAPEAPRGPWQRLYAAVLRARRHRARGRAVRLDRPAISVGNLHWGGGGKTPLVAAIARHLISRGMRPAILSRGYRRRGRHPVLVSTGGEPRVGWREAGDEPFLLAQSAPGAIVAVASSRAVAAALARQAGAVDVYLLDDAFSHVAVARDVELLVFPAADPFGGGKLLPGGRLREPLAASVLADAVLLTGLAKASPGAGRDLARALAVYGFRGPGFAVALDARVAAPPSVRAWILVSGTARSQPVLETARRCGVDPLDHLVFRDHHTYPRRSLRRIEAAARRHDAGVLTTSKDAMKLRGRLALPLGELETEARAEPSFFEWLDERLARLSGEDVAPQPASVRSKSGSPPSTG